MVEVVLGFDQVSRGRGMLLRVEAKDRNEGDGDGREEEGGEEEDAEELVDGDVEG